MPGSQIKQPIENETSLLWWRRNDISFNRDGSFSVWMIENTSNLIKREQ